MEAGDEDYGYQMWLCDYPCAVRADGALGQYILIIPEKDMVVVITECTLINGRTQRGLVWNRLLPEVGDEVLAAGKDYKKLQKKQSAYTLPFVQGKAASSAAMKYEGRSIVLDANKYGWKSLSLHFGQKEVKLAVTDKNGAAYELPFGYKQWLKTAVSAYPPYSITPIGSFKGIEGPFWVAGSYAWQSPAVLQLKAHYVNWISALGVTLRFEGDQVELTVTENFSSDRITIPGKIQ